MIKKNIMLLFMSVFHKDKNTSALSYNIHKLCDGRTLECSQTNEAPVMDVSIELAGKQEVLNYVYCITTDEVMSHEYCCIDKGKEKKYASQWLFFVDRMKNSIPELSETEFININYLEKDENENNIDTVLASKKCVNLMLHSLLKNIDSNTEFSNYRLFTDITGGYRNTTMILLSMLQLLQYSGMEIGRIIYSGLTRPTKENPAPINVISDFSNINNLFTLIAGADAFVKYGSSIAIEQFFKYDINGENQHISTPLSELLGCMHRFSDIIQICQTGSIMPAINELADSIRKFKDYQKSNEDEKIFSYLLKTIENGYGEIIKQDDIENIEKRLMIIEWCKKNKFYQQSMTLCTEWIPEIIVDKGIYYTKDKEIINNCTKSSKKKLRNWKQEFVVEYPTGQDKNSNVEQPIHKQELTDAVNRFALGSDVNLCLFGVKKINTNEINTLLNSFEDELCELKNTNVHKIISKAETSIVGRVIYNIWKRKLNDNYHTKFKQFVSKIDAGVLKDLVYWSDDDLKAILGITIDTKDDVSDEITNKIKNRIKYHREVLSDKANPIKSNYNIDEVISILEKYNWIRQYRNQINHANNSFVIKITELEGKIDRLISDIKSMK